MNQQVVKKASAIAPITAIDTVVCTYNDSEHQIAIWGNGSAVLVGDGAFNYPVHHRDVFYHHNVHGIKILSFQHDCVNFIAWGDKNLIYLSYSLSGYGFTTIRRWFGLDDIVLDAAIEGDVLVIGYAHGFIDIYQNLNQETFRRLYGPENCVLFSLSLSFHSLTCISIVGGTAFGKIHIWNATIEDLKDTLKDSLTKISDVTILAGHEGVIFRTCWSRDRRYLASVSDDRSVRVWQMSSSGGPLQSFVGWGHENRVWDVIFISSTHIATCSEDSTIRIWNFSTSGFNSCICKLVGHENSVWKIVPLIVKNNNTSAILSVGNDSKIEVWNLPSCLLSCPTSDENYFSLIDIPPSNADIDLKKSSRRQNGVCGVSIYPECNIATIVLIDGGIWLCDVSNIECCDFSGYFSEIFGNEAPKDKLSWYYIDELTVSLTCTSISYHASNVSNNSTFSINICSSHYDGTASWISISPNYSSERFEFSVTHRCSWRPFSSMRTVNIWECENGHILTASIQGNFQMWNVGSFEAEKDITPTLMFEGCVSTKEIICSCHLIRGSSILILGDSRGSIFLFLFDSFSLLEKCCLHRIHGSDPVSQIRSVVVENTTYVYSIGNNGYLCKYSVDFSIDPLLQLDVQISCLPIKTPDMLVVDSSSDSCDPFIIIIGGYQGSEYILWDVLRRRQYFRIEAGSWKRPHCCGILNLNPSSPRILFICPVPVGKDTKLKLIDSMPGRYRNDMQKIMPMESFFKLLGNVGHGKVCYSSAIWQTSLDRPPIIFTGGELGLIRSYYWSMDADQSIDRWVPFGNDLEMPFNSSLKSMVWLSSSITCEKGILVGGGGRLAYGIWIGNRQPCSKGSLLRQWMKGSIAPKGTQDHRIFSTSAVSLHREDVEHFLVGFTDSRGVFTLGLTSSFCSTAELQRNEKWIMLESRSISEYPLLCHKVIHISSDSSSNSWKFVVVFGDSFGTVFLCHFRVSLPR